jgi:guanylate kinase
MKNNNRVHLVVVAAPSGAGKTTIVRHLLKTFPTLDFSISAATRPRREHEIEGRDYYFISIENFKKRVAAGEFLEWEEVYSGSYYGTLKSEIRRMKSLGKDIIFDVDVKGAINIKRNYPEGSLAIFVKPPSLEVLADRLRARGTETEETIAKRLEKADFELTFEKNFDYTIVNDNLEKTLYEAEKLVDEFLKTGVN